MIKKAWIVYEPFYRRHYSVKASYDLSPGNRVHIKRNREKRSKAWLIVREKNSRLPDHKLLIRKRCGKGFTGNNQPLHLVPVNGLTTNQTPQTAGAGPPGEEVSSFQTCLRTSAENEVQPKCQLSTIMLG